MGRKVSHCGSLDTFHHWLLELNICISTSSQLPSIPCYLVFVHHSDSVYSLQQGFWTFLEGVPVQTSVFWFPSLLVWELLILPSVHGWNANLSVLPDAQSSLQRKHLQWFLGYLSRTFPVYTCFIHTHPFEKHTRIKAYYSYCLVLCILLNMLPDLCISK